MSRRVDGQSRCLDKTHTKPLPRTDRHTQAVTHTFLSVSHTHSVQRGGGSPSKVSPPLPPAGGSLLCSPSSLHLHRSDRPGFTSSARRPAGGSTCCLAQCTAFGNLKRLLLRHPLTPPPLTPAPPHIIQPSVASPTRSDHRCSQSGCGLCRRAWPWEWIMSVTPTQPAAD